jgi:hypothetical protein
VTKKNHWLQALEYAGEVVNGRILACKWVQLAAYEAWSKESGEKYLLDGRQFAERLKERGCTAEKLKGARGWSGITLK